MEVGAAARSAAASRYRVSTDSSTTGVRVNGCITATLMCVPLFTVHVNIL